jgi:hypothetical protein
MVQVMKYSQKKMIITEPKVPVRVSLFERSWTRCRSITQVLLPSVQPAIFGSYKHPNKGRVSKLVD